MAQVQSANISDDHRQFISAPPASLMNSSSSIWGSYSPEQKSQASWNVATPGNGETTSGSGSGSGRHFSLTSASSVVPPMSAPGSTVASRSSSSMSLMSNNSPVNAPASLNPASLNPESNSQQRASRQSSHTQSQSQCNSPEATSVSEMSSSGHGHNYHDDDLIPTAIVVKNIPFAIKKEQLLDVMSQMDLPLPYAFNYHFDSGVFRGLAFANFATPEETGIVIAHLNGREIGGRKLRVEYKKMLPAQERERIEREKREKRGQLEEQHSQNQSAANANANANANTNANANANANTNANQATNASAPPFVSSKAMPSLSSNVSVSNLSMSSAHSAHSSISTAATMASSQPSLSSINFNDRETMDLYSSLLLFQADPSFQEVQLPISAHSEQGRIVQILCAKLHMKCQPIDTQFGQFTHLTISKTLLAAPEYPSPLFRAALSVSGTSTPTAQWAQSRFGYTSSWNQNVSAAVSASSNHANASGFGIIGNVGRGSHGHHGLK